MGVTIKPPPAQLHAKICPVKNLIMTEAAPAKKAPKAKKPAVKPAHPSFAAMITAAVAGLAEKGGSSRKAILKYIVANYKVGDNTEKIQGNVRRAVKKMLAAKTLVPGSAKAARGVNGSVKLAEKPKKAKKAKKPKAKKPAKKVKKV